MNQNQKAGYRAGYLDHSLMRPEMEVEPSVIPRDQAAGYRQGYSDAAAGRPSEVEDGPLPNWHDHYRAAA